MELDLKREPVRDTTAIIRLRAVSEESGDVVVPDSLPDIIRIVETDAHIELKNKELRGGKLYAEAAAHISAVYVPETGGGLCRLAVSLPLSTVFDLGDAAEGSPQTILGAELLSAAARELNPRKISVKAVCDFACAVYAAREPEICTGVENPDDAEIQTAAKRVRLTSGVYEKTLTVSDSTELAANAADCAEILKYDLAIKTVDSKQIKNKVILKGEAQIRMLTLGGTDEKKVQTTEAVIPFAGVIDCDGVTEESAVDLTYRVAGCELNIVTENGTNRPLLAAKLNLTVCAEAWEEREITYVSDAYSLQGRLTYETESIPFCTAGQTEELRQTGRETISTGVAIKNVYLCSVSAENSACRPTETGMEAAADVKIKLILEAEDGGIYSLMKTAAVTAPLENKTEAAVSVTVSDQSYHISGSEDVEVRYTAAFRLTPERVEPITQICAMHLEDDDDADKRRPALTLCYAGANETFWTLGKRLGASVAEIRSANGLNGDCPPAGRLLLIPRGARTEGRV